MSYNVRIIETGISDDQLNDQLEALLTEISKEISEVRILAFGDNNTKGCLVVWQD